MLSTAAEPQEAAIGINVVIDTADTATLTSRATAGSYDTYIAGPGGGVDPDIKARNLTRLRRIEGQVRGLHKMVEEDRYCADVLTQISSVHEALRSVGKELMRNHLRHCATQAIKSSSARAEEMYAELLDLIYRHNR